ncbi:MAG TPA: hypothetical protein VFP39_11300 [Gemmatimonadales bacterium]|nr:hypothetical protein [Gemmatimonadales bacterium]
MPKRLSDGEVSELRRLSAEGVLQRDLAERFGVSQSFVSRVTRGERRERRERDGLVLVDGPVRVALEEWLAGFEFRGADRVRVRVAETLASAVDGCAASTTAAALATLPRLVGQLEFELERLANAADERPALDVKRLLREVQAG